MGANQVVSVLASHDPPVTLAKVEANAVENKGLAKQLEMQGFPTIKILKSGGEVVQDYKGPSEANGIVEYLKNQTSWSNTVEIKPPEDASSLIDGKKVFLVGIFPTLFGEEFENDTILANKLRLDYDCGHTTKAELLPCGKSSVTTPTIRFLKPFDELFVDFQGDHMTNVYKGFLESDNSSKWCHKNFINYHVMMVLKLERKPTRIYFLLLNFFF
ncbi:putative protein disulfide-isomerase [Helianthus debilis subsp. tardiflorus]